MLRINQNTPYNNCLYYLGTPTSVPPCLLVKWILFETSSQQCKRTNSVVMVHVNALTTEAPIAIKNTVLPVNIFSDLAYTFEGRQLPLLKRLFGRDILPPDWGIFNKSMAALSQLL